MTDGFRDVDGRNRFELDVDGIIAFVTYRTSPVAITLVLVETGSRRKKRIMTKTRASVPI